MRPILACLLVALLLVVIATATLTVDRFALKLDMTDNRIYELSQASHETLKSLVGPVRITVFAREPEFPLLLREILGRYASSTPLLSLRYSDPVSHPALVDSYVERGARIQPNDVIVEYGNRFRHYGIKDLYTLNAAGTQVSAVRAEQQVTGALVQLLSSLTPAVAFTDGHDEHPSKALLALFERNNYRIERLGPATQRLANSVDIIAIVAPAEDFSAQEIASIDGHLDRGGSLMIFLSPSLRPLPRLERLLAGWGLGVGGALVHEPRAHVSDSDLDVVPMYAPHEINKSFGDKRSFVLMPQARVLRLSDQPSFDLETMTVLSSTPDAFAERGANRGLPAKAEADGHAPFVLAATASRTPSAAQQLPGAAPAERRANAGRIFLSGSEKMVATDILGMANFANGEFLTQVMRWLNPIQAAIYIPAKRIAPDPLAIRAGEATAWSIMLTAVMPLLVLVAGVLVAFRRRQLR
ncbi:MAG: GldG family protein [Variovorax sp.]